MASLILFVLYSGLVVLEAILLYRFYEGEIKLSFQTALADAAVVNAISLVLIVVLFGTSLARMSPTGQMGYFFRTMLITWPQEVMKMSLFSIVADALGLAIWYRWRYPQLDPIGTFMRGALINLPALIIAGCAWIFMAVMFEFLHFLRMA